MPVRITDADLARLRRGAAPKKTAKPPRLVAPSSAVRLEVVVPIRLTSSANARDSHWSVRHRRVNRERGSVWLSRVS